MSELRETPEGAFVHESAYVDNGAILGSGTHVWHFSHIRSDAQVGRNCNIGQNVLIGGGVKVGNGVKIQNNVSVYEKVTLEDEVFCGPSMVFTNVINPRSHISRKEEFKPTLVRRRATIGANATIVCGVEIGAYAFIGAGAVVARDVLPHALMVGVPAKQIGWMSEEGFKLQATSETGVFICPKSGRKYHVTSDGILEPVQL